MITHNFVKIIIIIIIIISSSSTSYQWNDLYVFLCWQLKLLCMHSSSVGSSNRCVYLYVLFLYSQLKPLCAQVRNEYSTAQLQVLIQFIQYTTASHNTCQTHSTCRHETHACHAYSSGRHACTHTRSTQADTITHTRTPLHIRWHHDTS